MAGTKTVTEEDEWTKADLQKLLAALKTSIPEHGRRIAYHKGLKTVDWKQVAFPPFSPEACQEKFSQILQKMQKIRSLTELIVEAEDVLSNAVQKIKIRPEHPKRPSPPNVMFYEENCARYQKKHPDMSQQKLFKRLTGKYQELPDQEKAQYVRKFELATEEYARRMQEFCEKYKKPPNPEHKTNRKRKRLSADASDSEQSSGDEEDMPPKPPISGFHIFCKELRIPVSVSCRNWQDLTETKRDEYNTLCKELKRQYLVKLRAHLKTLNKEKREQILNNKSMKRFRALKSNIRKAEKTLPGEPKMPSRSGNQYFVKDQMLLLKEKFPISRERLGKASHMWHSLSNKEKERYNEKAREGLRKYWIELLKWFKTLPAAEREAYEKRHPSKWEYLGNDSTEISDSGDSCAVYRPSDSEDEDIEDSSGDEEENDSDRCEVKEEEEEEEEDIDAVMFKLY